MFGSGKHLKFNSYKIYIIKKHKKKKKKNLYHNFF